MFKYIKNMEPISRKHIKMIELAAKMAAVVPYQHKHGAVVTKGGAVIAKGRNSYYNLQHAETCAIGKQWTSELKGATLYVCRIRRNQKFGMSKPCEECMKAIFDAGITTIVFTTDDPLNPVVIEKIR